MTASLTKKILHVPVVQQVSKNLLRDNKQGHSQPKVQLIWAYNLFLLIDFYDTALPNAETKMELSLGTGLQQVEKLAIHLNMLLLIMLAITL